MKSELNQSQSLTQQKALQVNLNPAIYGTIAEIGAGQEVARQFFKAGGAAGTIAKTMSAYDMTFSDEIYGKSSRYVSRDRLLSMLAHEYKLLVERLGAKRGKESTFFVFADTVSARNFQGTNDCHGWLGVRFQVAPLAPPNDIIIHVRMKDNSNLLQQQALGAVGVNLLYGAFYHQRSPGQFIESLIDDLTTARIEIDMLEIIGPDFAEVDNRILSLKLVEHGLTKAVMFGGGKNVLQPSEILYKKPVIFERGSFRPVTNINTDMLACTERQFRKMPSVGDREVVSLVEITLHNLLSTGKVDYRDFLLRTDSLAALGLPVLVTKFPEFYLLPEYFRRYTHEPIGVALGLNHLLQIFEEKYYKNLEGGILEAFGRLFHSDLKLFVYPMNSASFRRYCQLEGMEVPASMQGTDMITAKNMPVIPHLRHLHLYLLENGFIQALEGYNENYLNVFSRDVLKLIEDQDPSWEQYVPAPAAAVIKQSHAFVSAPVKKAPAAIA
ncbi:MAG: TonB-dependent receptor [Deltaproteobacteria bacterium]|nr:TonB-dependent receptor [Deltaproteobacteria bacterium]